jgi:hypothetical protein
MKIVINPDIPDRTYFTSSEVAPVVSRNGNRTTLTVYDGQGTRRASWGKPGVTSTIVINRRGFVVVHVGFHHRYSGGQQWYYFVGGERRLWSQLTAKQQREVVAGKAPSWAKLPGNVKAA